MAGQKRCQNNYHEIRNINCISKAFLNDKKSDKNKFTILPPSKGYIGNRLKNRIL